MSAVDLKTAAALEPARPGTGVASGGRPAPVEATATNRPEVLAAVDIGTNSVHLVVARVRGLRGLEVIEREKEMVRLGSGGGDMKHLDEDAVDRGIAALARFREVADVHGAAVTPGGARAGPGAADRGGGLRPGPGRARRGARDHCPVG